ncbi:MAG: hypothetical protein HC893_11735 [Chloroflexaceae bacterium]|nr:hypothetical protein [Chloroflexaceae bacterium]NJO06336.1 hypothetical protein [Chloroflexaceae bacterium]
MSNTARRRWSLNGSIIFQALVWLVFTTSAVAWIALTIFVILPGSVRLWTDWAALRERGVQTEGVALSRDSETDEDSTTYYVTYRFTHIPPDGDPRAYTATDTVSWKVYNQAEPDAPLTVWYVSDDHTISTLEQESIAGLIVVSLGIAFFLAVSNFIAAGFLWGALDELRNAWYRWRRQQAAR